MATSSSESNDRLMRRDTDDDTEISEDEEEDQNWEDWNEDNVEGCHECSGVELSKSELLCLFCDSLFTSCHSLFQHCAVAHHFDFNAFKKASNLDFYGCFKLINYIRSQVAKHSCWYCGNTYDSLQDMQNHFHEVSIWKDKKLPWDDDVYLIAFLQEDPLLYAFDEDDVVEDENSILLDKTEILRDLVDSGKISVDDIEQCTSQVHMLLENGSGSGSGSGSGAASAPDCAFEGSYRSEKIIANALPSGERSVYSNGPLNDEQFDSATQVKRNNVNKINKDYFGAYSSFGIHREMISDQVRTNAYRRAILENPSLLRNAVVMDVGCGTGILSLFAAQAGASRVIAIDASEKMASVAAQIAKDNGLLRSGSSDENNSQCTGTIEVHQGMVEELDSIQHHSVDVIVSEWMGYCLLYESMLSSIIFARDKWLRPGGAVLPDTATIFVAGFGRGGTSLPFWENVYGFNMSCIGQEVNAGASRVPIVDVLEACHIVTSTSVLQAFDLVTMKYEDMNFSAEVELEPKFDTHSEDILTELDECKMVECHGLVLWFDTGFTERFCKEMPTVLSTSPFTPSTHWSHTILTFQEPVEIALGNHPSDAAKLGVVGTKACPASKIKSRISIARGVQHRSIDISIEPSAVGVDGRKLSLPVQIFHLS